MIARSVYISESSVTPSAGQSVCRRELPPPFPLSTGTCSVGVELGQEVNKALFISVENVKNGPCLAWVGHKYLYTQKEEGEGWGGAGRESRIRDRDAEEFCSDGVWCQCSHSHCTLKT